MAVSIPLGELTLDTLKSPDRWSSVPVSDSAGLQDIGTAGPGRWGGRPVLVHLIDFLKVNLHFKYTSQNLIYIVIQKLAILGSKLL